MKKKLIILSGFAILVLVPMVALAQSTNANACNAQNTGGLGTTSATGVFKALCTIQNVLNAVIPVLVTLGVVYFIWGVISYVISGDEEAKKKGRDRIIFGIIGLAVIIGLWGLVRILTNTFGLDTSNNNPINLPVVR